MDTSARRFIRLAIVSATAAGVALASPAIAVADDSEAVDALTIDDNSDPPFVQVPTTEPLVIELIVEGDPPTDSTESTESPSDATAVDPAGDAALTTSESPSDDPPPEAVEDPTEADEMRTATFSEPIGTEPSPMIAALETGSSEAHSGGTGEDHTGGSGGTGEDHTGGSGGTGGTGGNHTGGSGGTGGNHTGGSGTGDPYLMTFEVSWHLDDGSPIPVLEVPTDWRTMFDLAAASETGGGKPTSAHCTYPDGSTDLACEFQNPGKHSSVTDAMIVPAKSTATYTVTVPWPISGWTIDGANAESYSARDLCPRGGHGGGQGGHDSGHDSGHDETPEVAALEDSGSICLHTVVMRQAAATQDPPAQDPPAQDPPATEVPADDPPQNQTPVPPVTPPAPPVAEVLPTTAGARTLPATGNTATTTLMIGTIILAVGGCLSVLARRRDDLPLG